MADETKLDTILSYLKTHTTTVIGVIIGLTLCLGYTYFHTSKKIDKLWDDIKILDSQIKTSIIAENKLVDIYKTYQENFFKLQKENKELKDKYDVIANNGKIINDSFNILKNQLKVMSQEKIDVELVNSLKKNNIQATVLAAKNLIEMDAQNRINLTDFIYNAEEAFALNINDKEQINNLKLQLGNKDATFNTLTNMNLNLTDQIKEVHKRETNYLQKISDLNAIIKKTDTRIWIERGIVITVAIIIVKLLLK